ncbi:MAG: site-2 protease family protein [Planctomycetota bacterium]
MAFLQTGFEILLMLVGFGSLIFVHELGHFLAAKWAGIRTEGFAVGMGPHVFSWRKGLGFCLGSSEKRRREAMVKFLEDSDDEFVKFRETPMKKLRLEDYGRISDAAGLGETEYSLRWLPIGGFVKMLGQDDSDPTATSSDPRSYNMRPIGKRMVVVSAGVIMNVIFAAILFVIAFMIGVKFPAPVVGDLVSTMPASDAIATNADSLGVDSAAARIHPGDRVVMLNGKPVDTFADVNIAGAMARPGRAVSMQVERDGLDEPLHFNITPAKDPATGLLGFGITSAASTTIFEHPKDDVRTAISQVVDVDMTGIEPGMRMLTANDQSISTYNELNQIIREGDGTPVQTRWSAIDKDGEAIGQGIDVELNPLPAFERMLAADAPEEPTAEESGLIGLVPRLMVAAIDDSSRNADVLENGDVFISIGRIDYPTQREFREFVGNAAGRDVPATIERDGERMDVTLSVSREGRVDLFPGYDWDSPTIAGVLHSMKRVTTTGAVSTDAEPRATPFADAELFAGTRIVSIAGTAIADWADIRAAVRAATADAHAEQGEAQLSVTVQPPTADADAQTMQVTLASDDVAALHALGWSNPLPGGLFDSVTTRRHAGGNPVLALRMGVEETHNMIMSTYLTIDRLFRRSVGIEQLHGPVGIIHLGTRVLDRGFPWLIFFLAAISVNLAVINFLPLPIVDGGLFLFLIYEKFKGKPPSVAFQNAAMIVGLVMIGALFVITFYNDVMRILGS